MIFERVNLTDASFLDARLDAVSFVSCRLGGADFRGARLNACSIRGSSLDGVLGVESLAGVRMPWPDILDSAAALADGTRDHDRGLTRPAGASSTDQRRPSGPAAGQEPRA